MKKLLSLILACAVLVSCLAFTGCGESAAVNADVEKEWQIVAYDDGEGVVFKQRVCFDVTRNSKKIDEIWLKVSSLAKNAESASLTFQRYSTDTTSSSTPIITAQGTAFTNSITKKQVKEAKKELNGWIKFSKDAWQHNSSYVLLICEGNITLDEVVFVDEDGKRLTYEVDYAEIVYENTNGDIRNKVYTADELKAISDAKYGLPLNLNNDQESFDKRAEK